MESKQLNENTVENVLERVNIYIKKLAGEKVNILRFDIGNEPNMFKYTLAKAYQRVLETRLCDLKDEITDEFLEKVKLRVNVL